MLVGELSELLGEKEDKGFGDEGVHDDPGDAAVSLRCRIRSRVDFENTNSQRNSRQR